MPTIDGLVICDSTVEQMLVASMGGSPCPIECALGGDDGPESGKRGRSYKPHYVRMEEQ